jgi:hypothetical protein
MTHEVIEIESKDADRVHILAGTIVSTSDGMAEVDIDGYEIFADVPVFYHCPDSETADGMPFTENDRVLIVNSGDAVTLSVANMKVIGFEDGLPRSCQIRIRLYRGDGVEVTGWGPGGGGNILTFLTLRNSNNEWIEQTVEYNEETKYWELSVDNKEDEDPKGYWIVWRCVDGRLGNYPYRYFPVWDAVGAVSNLRQEEDLVKSGDLIDIIPYFSYDQHSDAQENCHSWYAGFQTSAQRWTIARSSVAYYTRFKLGVLAPETNCLGPGWVLSCTEFSHTVAGILPDLSAFTSLQPINVQIPEVVAEEIKSKLGDGLGEWDNFNAQFPSISVGDGGISFDTFISNFIKGGSYDISISAFPSPVPYTLAF